MSGRIRRVAGLSAFQEEFTIYLDCGGLTMPQKYPKITLEKALKLAEVVYKQNKECKVTVAATAAGYTVKSGPFKTIKAAAKWYGLITEDAGVFKLAAVGSSILAPLNDDEKASALKKAFLSFNLFQQLYDELPQDAPLTKERIMTVAERVCNVDVDQKENFVTIFLESATFVKLLTQTPEGLFAKEVKAPAVPDYANKAETVTVPELAAEIAAAPRIQPREEAVTHRRGVAISLNLHIDSNTDIDKVAALIRQLTELGA